MKTANLPALVFGLLISCTSSAAAIDMTYMSCADVQALLNPYLLDRSGQHHRVELSGTLTTTFGDLHRASYTHEGEVRNDGPYAYCFGLVPTTQIANGYPVSDGSRLDEGASRLTIVWDNAEIQYDPVGQDLPAVIYLQGDSYVSGFLAGTINGGLVERGFLDIRILDYSNTPGFGHDRVVAMASDQLFESPTTTVGILSFGLQRSSVADLVLRINGKAKDTDDIGLVQIESWGIRRTGGLHIREMSTGVQYYSGAGTTLGQAYFPWNPGPDIVIGDPVNGAGVHYFERCANGDCDFRGKVSIYGLTIHDSVIEGTKRGLLLAFGGCRQCQFHNNHWEQGNAIQHSILLGAGQCAASDQYRVCGSDDECPNSLSCNVPTHFWIDRVIFTGSSFGSDSGWTKKDSLSPFYLGKGASRGDGTIFIELVVGKDNQPDGNTYYFDFDPAAKVKVDFSRSVPQHHSMIMPDYPYIIGEPQ